MTAGFPSDSHVASLGLCGYLASVAEMLKLAEAMHEKPPRRQDPTEVLIGFSVLVATLVISVLGIVLIGFAVLREKPEFWTYAGGYPILLRDIVRWTFTPLYFGSVLVLLGLSMVCFAKLCRSLSFFVWESMLLLVCWSLLATSGVIAFKNNFINILNDAPLHEHQK